MATSWPRMERRGPVVTDEDIRAFEHTLGATLPDDYRAFLLEVNGGRTGEEHVTFAVRKDESTLNSLFSLNDPSAAKDLKANASSRRERMSADVIAIGYDDLGGDVCLVV